MKTSVESPFSKTCHGTGFSRRTDAFAAAALAVLLASSPANAWECSAKTSVAADPVGLTQAVWGTVMNPLRSSVAESTQVVSENSSQAGESGRLSVRSWNYGTWSCNYSSVRGSDGSVNQITAKHCVSEKFQGVSNDYWDSSEFDGTQLRARVVQRTEKVLEFADFPEEGDRVTVVGCFPSWTRECFRVTGFFNELYSRGEEKVYGIWVSPKEYGKIVHGEMFSSLEGLSGSPAIDVDGKVFWTVSATLFADYRETAEWSCVIGNYAIALALMPKEWKKSERENLARK